MNRHVHTVIKMALAMMMGFVLASLLDLNHALAAGILAVLSIQSTRTDSFFLATKRLLDAALALALSTGFFLLFGYETWVFVIFAMAFIAVSFLFGLQAGIVPSLVLASHLLEPSTFDFSVLLNSTLLMGIAVATALFLNLIYPMRSHSLLQTYSRRLDALVKAAFEPLVEGLRGNIHSEARHARHTDIRHSLRATLRVAEEADKDLLFDRDHQVMQYLRMRHMQMRRIDRLQELLDAVTQQHPHALELADYIQALIPDIGQVDRATIQLEKLNVLLNHYRQQPLPTTRDAFETRAILFQMIYELQAFLTVKLEYHERFDTLQL